MMSYATFSYISCQNSFGLTQHSIFQLDSSLLYMHKRSPLDVESHQEMHSTTSQQMDQVQEDHRKSTPGQPDRLHITPRFFIKTTLQMIAACSECPSTIVLLFILPMTMIEKVRGCIWR